jgi:hypothetical protein
MYTLVIYNEGDILYIMQNLSDVLVRWSVCILENSVAVH